MSSLELPLADLALKLTQLLDQINTTAAFDAALARRLKLKEKDGTPSQVEVKPLVELLMLLSTQVDEAHGVAQELCQRLAVEEVGGRSPAARRAAMKRIARTFNNQP